MWFYFICLSLIPFELWPDLYSDLFGLFGLTKWKVYCLLAPHIFVWFGKWNRKWVHPTKFHGMTPWKIIPFFSNQTCSIYFLFLFVVLFNIKGHVSRHIWLHFGNPFLSTLYRLFCSFAQKYGSTMWQQNIATWLDGYNLGPVWYSSCWLWHQLLAIVFNTVLHSFVR